MNVDHTCRIMQDRKPKDELYGTGVPYLLVELSFCNTSGSSNLSKNVRLLSVFIKVFQWKSSWKIQGETRNTFNFQTSSNVKTQRASNRRQIETTIIQFIFNTPFVLLPSSLNSTGPILNTSTLHSTMKLLAFSVLLTATSAFMAPAPLTHQGNKVNVNSQQYITALAASSTTETSSPFTQGPRIIRSELPILYVYDHCPFCVRVRLALGVKNIKHNVHFLQNDDISTPTKLIGKKISPIFVSGVKAVLCTVLISFLFLLVVFGFSFFNFRGYNSIS